ncbi:glycosyltransferase [Moellerella wisconsensis]|uniref:glycosyltransferase n=1 Tax=Moellerella wisconsensis TaxID=158849 RepID=UPI00069BBD03|nr:glycosyltransferase [Moellerella wisconsensis]
MMNLNKEPILSIIIVNFNCADGLNKTLSFLKESLNTYNNPELIEIIVIDGLSNDNSLEIANKFSKIITKFVRESDRGIYDAMNKGIYYSKGKYCYFLNTNDIFNFDLLIKLIPKMRYCEKKMLIFNVNVFDQDGKYIRTLKPSNISLNDFKTSMPICHQGVFFLKTHELFYNSQYKIIADKDLVYRYLKTFNDSIEFFNFEFMDYKRDGFSVNNIRTWKYENLLFTINNFGFSLYLVRAIVSYLKSLIIRKN